MKWLSALLLVAGCASSFPVTSTSPDQCSQEYDQRHATQVTRFPRKIVIDPQLPQVTAESAFVAADRWNQAMVADVFDVTVAVQTHDDIEVIQMVHWNDTRVGSTWWNSGHAVVEIREDFVGVPNMDGLFAHEFGHALNLNHEPNDPDSWMHNPHGPNLSEYSHCMVAHALAEWEASR
jgi:hypothetical protein